MKPTIPIFHFRSRKPKLFAACDVGYRCFDLVIACYWLRVRVSWNAYYAFFDKNISGVGFDWNDRRVEFGPHQTQWEHWKYKFSYSEVL